MRRAVLLLAVLTAAFAPAPFPKRERQAPPAALEGLWQGQAYQIIITPTRMIYRPGTPSETVCDLILHPNANPPAYGITSRGNSWRGIYRLRGDRLTLGYGYGTRRPADFRQDGIVLEVYERVR